MDATEFVETYGPIVSRKARSLANEYTGIDPEDIEQEIYAELLKPHRLREIATHPQFAERVIYRAGQEYANRERYDFMFHSAQYVYTPKEVRALFGAFFVEANWEKPPTKDSGDNVTSGGVVVSLWDIDRAYGTLSVAEQTVIAKRHAQGDQLVGGEQDRYERSVDKVTRFLNRGITINEVSRDSHEGPGSRRAMTNEAARYITGQEN